MKATVSFKEVMANEISLAKEYLDNNPRKESYPVTLGSIDDDCHGIYCHHLSDEEKALMYDLAARKKRTVPSDIEDVMMYSESGSLARMALRMTNAGIAKEEDWKEFIRQLERKKQEEEQAK